MKLFPDDPSENILPYNGTVNYHGLILPEKEATNYFKNLLEIVDWKHDEAIVFGKKVVTKRKVAWYADEAFVYRYSGVTKRALIWPSEILKLKKQIEMHSGETFNSCLLNLYHTGEEGMAWHSDGEKELKKNGAIASLSLGAERKFSLKHKKTKEKVSIRLEHGSLLIMKDETQIYWLHQIPPTKKVNLPRISLTFRTINKTSE